MQSHRAYLQEVSYAIGQGADALEGSIRDQFLGLAQIVEGVVFPRRFGWSFDRRRLLLDPDGNGAICIDGNGDCVARIALGWGYQSTGAQWRLVELAVWMAK